jgi:RimJ/RimL family protein N-acetyltransferase
VKVRAFETPDDFIHSMSWMNQVIREGKTWPFEDEFQSLTEFQGYFTSHAAFVVRKLIPPSSPCLLSTRLENNAQEDDLMGCFYIKPNFPGRCSHICNGGFITAPMYRGMGVGKLMGKVYLKLAKSLGYKSSYFNLVFESNVASVRLWESLGFQRVARLERAARLKGLKENEILWDTALGYRYDLESFQEEKDYLEPIPWLKQDIVLK